MKADKMSDAEILEHLELGAVALRMAKLEDLRKVADQMADVGAVAADRLRELAGDRVLLELRGRVSRLEDAAFHFQTCATCRREGHGACNSGRRFAAYLCGELDDDQPRPACVCGHAFFSHRFDGSGVCSECSCTEYRYTAAAADPGPMIGKVRGVVLHADGRLTCELEVTGAGRAFVEQITRGAS